MDPAGSKCGWLEVKILPAASEEKSGRGPDPDNKHPMAGFPQVCFIKNTISNPNIIVGEYTY